MTQRMSSYFLIVCLFLAGLHVSLCSPELPPADDNLNIYALPVGQGDCTVIQCPKTGTLNGKGNITIIDAGAKKHHFEKKAFTDYLKGATIKHIILTHPHTDHYNLIESILHGHTETPLVYHSCKWEKYKNTKINQHQFLEIKSCMEGGDTPCNIRIQLCDTQSNVMLKVIASGQGGCGKHPNKDSIVSKITYNGVSTLISGDFEGNDTFVRDFVQSVGNEIKANIYRLAHHGAYSDKTNGLKPNHPDILKVVTATYYFSSSGLDDTKYRHPRYKLYDEISKITYHKESVHPYTYYHVNGTKVSFTTDEPIYVTTLEENGHRKDYVIRFAIKKDRTIEPTITPFDGTLKGHSEL